MTRNPCSSLALAYLLNLNDAALQRAAKELAEPVVEEIRRVPRKHHSAEGKIRIVLEDRWGEDSMARHSTCFV